MRRLRAGRSTFILRTFGGNELVGVWYRGPEYGTMDPEVEVVQDQGYE
jgi:hypothetical protein